VSLLLDTHIVLWWLADDPQLADEIKDRLDHEPDVRVSAATVWEIAIKQALGKITAPPDLPERVRDSGFRELPVRSAHAMAAGRLPMITATPSTGCSWHKPAAKTSPLSPATRTASNTTYRSFRPDTPPQSRHSMCRLSASTVHQRIAA
jgi:PIN domain nuclease of toxin-antitoxin system